MNSRAFASMLVSLFVLSSGLPSGSHGEAEDSPPEVQAAHELLDALAVAKARRGELALERDAAKGERRELVEERIWQSRLESHRLVGELSENLQTQLGDGRDVTAIQQRMVDAIRDGWPATRDQLLALEQQLEEARTRLDEAPADGREALEDEVRTLEQRVEDQFRLLTESLVLLEPTGVDVADERAFATDKLTEWADLLAARTQVLLRRRDDATERASADPDDAAAKGEAKDAEEQLDRTTGSLALFADLMDSLEIPTSGYRQVLIAATGEITSDILNRDVALGLLRKMRDGAIDGIANGAPTWLFKAFFFFLILAAFRAASTLVRRVVSQSIRSSNLNLSQLLQETLVSWSSKIVLMVGVLVALSQLGIEIGALLAGLGIAGFVLGFALQDTLSNFAAGAMILIYRPFDVGDIIEAATVTGAVSRMTLVSTTILTFDNQTLIVPNSKIWGDVIRNVTAQNIRRVDLMFGIGYRDDIDQADAVLRDILANHDQVLAEPKPIVEVHELGDSSVNFVVRPWCKTEDYWQVHWSLTRQVKQRFDREGINIPFPQRDVHHYFETSPARTEA